MNDIKAWAIVCEDKEEASYAFATTTFESEDVDIVGRQIAEERGLTFIEAVPIEDFLGGSTYELCFDS